MTVSSRGWPSRMQEMKVYRDVKSEASHGIFQIDGEQVVELLQSVVQRLSVNEESVRGSLL